jgi:hypothetical protein
VIATDEQFENFIVDNDEWFSDIELRAIDLEKELSEWRESRARELAESAQRREREREVAEAAYLRESERELAETRSIRGRQRGFAEQGFERETDESAPSRTAAFRRADGAGGQGYRGFLRATGNTGHERNPGRTSDAWTRPRPAAGRAWPIPDDGRRSADVRTRVLIDRGRRMAGRRRSRRGRKIAIASAVGLIVVIIGAMIVFRQGPSWPPSVATVKSEITTACQNPNVVSEPSQVNFACSKDTSQILWVFALMTSNNNPNYSDAKTGRKGLEPITPAQGGQIAWSLNLHHPYNPFNAIDSLQVAARAINNIIGGATLTSADGNPAVQPGLESKPANCARYTGSSAMITHAGFPSLCASPLTSREGQAALAADVYQQWMVGATAVAAQDVSVLFQNADNPGDPQVQAILKALPSPGR